MATSTITLYSTKILENENYIVDDINTYLFLCPHLTHSNSQFIRNALDISIKLSDVAFNWDDTQAVIYNYCRIGNASGNTQNRACYYFIREVKWLAQNTIQLVLHMDVLNTFKNGIHFEISDRTIITREHKNRFIYRPQDGIYIPYIDLYSEGINPKLYITNMTKKVIHDVVSAYSPDFYLMYKNSLDNTEDASNVVNCFLISNAKITFTSAPVGATLTISDLEDGVKYYCFPHDSHATYTYNGQTHTFDAQPPQMFIFFKSGSDMRLYVYDYPNGDANPPYDSSNPSISIFKQFTISQIAFNTNDIVYYQRQSYIETNRQTIYTSYDKIVIGATSYSYTAKKYDEVNRTDSRIIKIIKIPYAPNGTFSWDSVNNKMNYDATQWEFDKNEMLLKMVITNKFENTTLQDVMSEIIPLKSVSYGENDAQLQDDKSDDFEPKMYHSDFYQTKYIYDSFSKVIQWEFVNATYIRTHSTLDIKFYMTQTINSKFMFYYDAVEFEYSTEDFNYPLIVQRNNEEVLYNSAYINYIRSGFNYDVKAKNQQEAVSWITAGVTMVGGIASLAFGSKTLGAGLIASSVMALTGAISTTANAERNLQQKMEALRWQANSVYGADDVDLMSKYAQNKLLRVNYEASDKMKNLIKELFFHTGYIENRMGIPDVNSRSWFNYLACEIKFIKTNNIPSDALEELIERYKGGVTFFHKNNVPSTTGTIPYWDFEKQYANWEVSLLTWY